MLIVFLPHPRDKFDLIYNLYKGAKGHLLRYKKHLNALDEYSRTYETT